jgi:hypothetical protein
LFTYEAIEATRACSQSLTIFGEKWPGAVKYRDIFDELSGSLFRAIMAPEPSRVCGQSPPLRVNINTHDPVSHNVHGQPAAQAQSQTTGSIVSGMVSDAVRDAFMEVDEEAPGGWQGWRMWNEMVSEDTNDTSASASRNNGTFSGYDDFGWHAYGDTTFGGLDPVQGASMEMAGSQWDMRPFGQLR